jgi:hypothetical protein
VIYESEKDRARQEVARRCVERAEGVDVLSTPPKATIDWLMHSDGLLLRIAEFKWRNISFQSKMIKTEGVTLSRDEKYRPMLAMVKHLKVYAYFYVWSREGLFRARLEPGLKGQLGGRTTDTRREGDIEMVVMVPAATFVPVVDADDMEAAWNQR